MVKGKRFSDGEGLQLAAEIEEKGKKFGDGGAQGKVSRARFWLECKGRRRQHVGLAGWGVWA
ncbi:hypothetical protein Droror1_Dr00020769, partial [Drosera rotundifolia]